MHPQRRLIAYHFFWEDDIDFPEDNDPCDHEADVGRILSRIGRAFKVSGPTFMGGCSMAGKRR